MTKFPKFLLKIKRPNRLCYLSALTTIAAGILIGMHQYNIYPEPWALKIAGYILIISFSLLFLSTMASWAQTAHLLDKVYLNFRHYEIIFEEMKLNVESAKEYQKFRDNPKPSILTFSEWVIAELKHIDESIELMKEAVDIIEKTHNNTTHD